MTESRRISRRRFLAGAGVATVLPLVVPPAGRARSKRHHPRPAGDDAAGPRTHLHARQSHVGRRCVGDGRSDLGRPASGVKEQVLALKPWLVGSDPSIDTLYTPMGRGNLSLSGTRNGSAHNLMRAVSGIEMALSISARFAVPATTSRRTVPDTCASTTMPPARISCSTVRRRWRRRRSGAHASDHLPPAWIPSQRSGDRQRAEPRQSHADEGTDRDAVSGYEKLPRGDRGDGTT